jgi:hypothetical protein
MIEEAKRILDKNQFVPRNFVASKIKANLIEETKTTMKQAIVRKEKKSMKDTIKKYYKEHEDILFPLFIVIILDHFFNNGGLRERIVGMAQSLLDSIQGKLENKQLTPKE